MNKGTNTIKILLEHPETEHSEEVMVCFNWFFFAGSPPSEDDPYGEPGGFEYVVNSWKGPDWVNEELILNYLYETDYKHLIY
jgi:hypothetical protein